MAGFGPPPKPESQQRRRNRGLAGHAVRLPAAGRRGEPPVWPLSRPTKRESALWERLWKTPHATMWEKLGWADVVARYTRLLVVANERKPPAAILSEVRQLEDRLGLTPMAMLRLRWEVTDDVEDLEEESPDVIDIRNRIKAVE